MSNPENRESDWHKIIRVVDSQLIGRKKMAEFIKDVSRIPVSLSTDYNLYFGAAFHDDMVRDPEDVLFDGYAKYSEGRVKIERGPHHNKQLDQDTMRAVEDLLTLQFQKYLKS